MSGTPEFTPTQLLLFSFYSDPSYCAYLQWVCTVMKTTKQEFFGFFRQRLANLKQIEALEPAVKMGTAASFNPELNILLSAELDALA